jgi:hypothetical protein
MEAQRPTEGAQATKSVNEFFSASEDSVQQVKLIKGASGFGFRVDVATKGQMQITKVVAQGPADLSGKIHVHDLILGINDLKVGKELALATPEAVQAHLHAVGAVNLVLGQRPATSTATVSTHRQVSALVPRVVHPKSQEYEQKLATALAEVVTSAAVDHQLGVQEEVLKLQQEQKQENGQPDQPFSDALTPLLSKLVQGSRSPLLALAKECLSVIESAGFTVTLESVSAKISRIADRKCYGSKPKNSSVWENEDDEAMWQWEVHEVEHICISAVDIRELRSERNKLGANIRSLIRLCAELRKANNEAKISGEEAKVLKTERLLETDRQKQRARKEKEQEKLKTKNAKDEAKKQEKLRKEEEKVQSKQQKLQPPKKDDSKSLHMFFGKKPAAPASKPAASAPRDTNVAQNTNTKAQQLDAELRKPKNITDLRQQVSKWAMEAVGADSAVQETDSRETPMKFLHFHENMRPAYYGESPAVVGGRGVEYCRFRAHLLIHLLTHLALPTGTWSKKSAVVGATRPLACDTALFDYEVDSDDDWDDEPGVCCAERHTTIVIPHVELMLISVKLM